MRKLFEVYFFEDTPLSGALENQLCDMIGDMCGQFDVVIANDFGHGMITDKAIRTATAHAPFLAVNAQTNSGNQGYNLITKYRSADYVCIDGPEARLAASDRFRPARRADRTTVERRHQLRPGGGHRQRARLRRLRVRVGRDSGARFHPPGGGYRRRRAMPFSP